MSTKLAYDKYKCPDCGTPTPETMIGQETQISMGHCSKCKGGAKKLVKIENQPNLSGTSAGDRADYLYNRSEYPAGSRYGSISPADLASSVAKTARILTEEDLPNGNPDLQKMVGDPDDFRTSTFAQFGPNPGDLLLPNPLSPVEGDEVFFAYMMPGAIFQAHDGSQWWILGYDYRGQVEIENRWYPRIHAQVSVYDVRRSIDQWIEPIQQTVPPPPPGVNYDAQPVTIVDKEDFGAVDDLSTGHPNRGGSGGW